MKKLIIISLLFISFIANSQIAKIDIIDTIKGKIMASDNGIVYIGTSNGVFCFKSIGTKDSTWKLDIPTSFGKLDIVSIDVKNGNIHIGAVTKGQVTYGYVVYKNVNSDWKMTSLGNSIPNNIIVNTHNPSNINSTVLTSDGLYEFIQSTFGGNYIKSSGMVNNYMSKLSTGIVQYYDINEVKQTWWIDNNDLIHYNEKDLTNIVNDRTIKKYDMGDENVSVIVSKNNNFYYSANGIHILNPNTGTKIRTLFSGKTNNKFDIDSKGNVWFHDVYGYVEKYNVSSNTFSNRIRINSPIKDLKVDNLDRLLVATLNGVYVIDTDVTPALIVNGTTLETTIFSETASYQWFYYNGVSGASKRVSSTNALTNYEPIADANSNIYEATKTGKYKVRIIDGVDTTFSSETEVKVVETGSITSVNEYSLDNQVSVFPNPNTGTFTITTEEEGTTVTLIDVRGTTETHKLNSFTNQITTMFKGIVLVSVSSEKGKTVKRLVIQ